MPNRPASINFGTYLGERTITLYDGTEVSNYSTLWLAECGARHKLALEFLAMPTKDVRIARLERLSAPNKAFTPEYRRRLEAVILSIWRANQAAIT